MGCEPRRAFEPCACARFGFIFVFKSAVVAQHTHAHTRTHSVPVPRITNKQLPITDTCMRWRTRTHVYPGHEFIVAIQPNVCAGHRRDVMGMKQIREHACSLVNSGGLGLVCVCVCVKSPAHATRATDRVAHARTHARIELTSPVRGDAMRCVRACVTYPEKERARSLVPYKTTGAAADGIHSTCNARRPHNSPVRCAVTIPLRSTPAHKTYTHTPTPIRSPCPR